MSCVFFRKFIIFTLLLQLVFITSCSTLNKRSLASESLAGSFPCLFAEEMLKKENSFEQRAKEIKNKNDAYIGKRGLLESFLTNPINSQMIIESDPNFNSFVSEKGTYKFFSYVVMKNLGLNYFELEKLGQLDEKITIQQEQLESTLGSNDSNSETSVSNEPHILWFKYVDPLFSTLLSKKENSISIPELFNIALGIYSDPINALGAISFLTATDAISSDESGRDLTALISSKIQFENPYGDDRAGYIYHFFNYVIWELFTDGFSSIQIQSYGYEILLQKDKGDRFADKKGILSAKKIKKLLREKGAFNLTCN